MKVGIIVFARFSSKRLRGKALKKINKVHILEIILKRIFKVSEKIPVIVATSKNFSDNKIVSFCKAKKIKYFRGSLNNVLNRARDCCHKFGLDSFVRICADRPLLDYDLLKKMIKSFMTNRYDIVTNVFPKTYPYGLTCEIIKLSLFKKMKKNKIKKEDFEHIFNYFYRNKKSFKIKNFFSKNKKNQSLKLSLDTKNDFELIKKLYENKNYDFLIKTDKAIKEFKTIV